MTNRITNIMTSLALAGLAVFLGVLQTAVTAAPAQALAGNGHGPGYLSADGWWLGTYRLDDGRQGFCLNAGRPSPTGHVLDYRDGAALGWFTPAQSAKLAYIARTWAGTTDRFTAASGQLATWLVAGLGGHTPEQLAARAGSDAAAVLARARGMVEEASRLGSTGVDARMSLELAETGPGRVRVDLTVARLSGPATLPAGAHRAHVTLDGATFADGTAAADIPSGTDIPIVPSGEEPSVSVTADAALGSLPYGSGITVAVPRDDAQSVLVALPATAKAHAAATVSGPSPLPFQPRVETVTSTATAAPGASLTDRLTVTVDAGAGLLPVWGVRTGEEGMLPIEATVESTLLGPFPDPIRPAPTAPEDAPTVCTVETVVTGPGEYTTPSCELPATGYYVWTERIDPSRTPSDQGGERLRPWTSTFGVASEVTFVPPPVPVTPEVPEAPAPAPAAAAPVTAELAATGSEDALLPAGMAAAVATVGAALLAAARRRARRRAAEAPRRRATFRPVAEATTTTSLERRRGRRDARSIGAGGRA